MGCCGSTPRASTQNSLHERVESAEPGQATEAGEEAKSTGLKSERTQTKKDDEKEEKHQENKEEKEKNNDEKTNISEEPIDRKHRSRSEWAILRQMQTQNAEKDQSRNQDNILVGDLRELRSATSKGNELDDDNEDSLFAKKEFDFSSNRLLDLFERYGENVNLIDVVTLKKTKSDGKDKNVPVNGVTNRTGGNNSSLIYHAALEPLLKDQSAPNHAPKNSRRISVSADKVIGLNKPDSTVLEIWEKRITFETLCYCLEDLKIEWSPSGLRALFNRNDLDKQQRLTYYQFVFTLHCLAPQMKTFLQPLINKPWHCHRPQNKCKEADGDDWHTFLPFKEYNVRGQYQLEECVDLLQLALKRSASANQEYDDGVVLTIDDNVFLSYQIVKHVLEERDSLNVFPNLFQTQLWPIYQKLVLCFCFFIFLPPCGNETTLIRFLCWSLFAVKPQHSNDPILCMYPFKHDVA
ncbi:hypothetical protein RFI_20260 [Reticulomyxa filosa]|uniref:Uncharacterized protein n=1 Tax=Reticulomyxa filosa TaxID=46433 RepID=X6MTA5_RETFI|nr:hypothetical protein RFI_20260 [Reticulomyxa filosa]|eukprot:ETO17074.1 hypothetical protein RFI_20260 [Reticulomyxa filosa]